MALGSLAELETQYYVALDLEYTSSIAKIRKMLLGLIKFLKEQEEKK